MKDKGEDAKKIGIMVASHNEDTVRFAIEKMKEIGISPEDKVICFGQLLGMCDYITMPLGNAQYTCHIRQIEQLNVILLFLLLQVKLDIRPTSTYHTVQCTKYCLICLDALKRIKAFCRKSKRRNDSCDRKYFAACTLANCSTNQRAIMCRYKFA